jgi:glycosyltransferase involved in cell wall biosynthesis
MIKFRYGLMKRLVAEGYDLTVIAPKDAFSDQIEALGCRYIDLKLDNKGSSILADLRLIFRLRRLYKSLSPDLIFHYTIKPNIYGSIAANMAGVCSIAVVTGLGYTFLHDGLTAKVARRLYKFAFRYPRRVWFINQEDRNKFLLMHLVSKEKVELLPGEGIDTKKFAPMKIARDDDRFRFILIARLLWDKGIGEYVKAAKELQKRYENVCFQLVGFLDAQNPEAVSKEQVAFWVEKGYIEYLGSTDDVRLFLAQADCMVLPSYREGVSMILMEAASMQKPIIASNVPGCRDLVNHNVSGLLCNPKDYRDLMAKMELMLKLPVSQRQMMGQMGRKLILDEYDEKYIIEKYLLTIETLTQYQVHRRFRRKQSSEELL